MSKVKFGLRGFEYGVLNDKNLVPGETKKIPGLKSAKLDITNELNTITADDGPYVVLSSGITGTTLEVSWLDLGSESRKDFYGITVENGVEKYNKKMTPNDIACLFRTLVMMVKVSGLVFLKVNSLFQEWIWKPKMVHQNLRMILFLVASWLVEMMMMLL